MAMNAAGSVYDTTTSPPLVSQGATGAISGGILRPGSIDQGAFVQALQEAQQNREAAGVGGKPVSMPIQPFQANIPTLSSAQFAALVGAQADNPPIADPDAGAAADPQSAARVPAPVVAGQAAFVPAAAAMKLSGRPSLPSGSPGGSPGGSASGNPAGASTDPDPAAEDAPTIARVGTPTLVASADGAASNAEDAAAATASPDGKANGKSADAAKTPPADPDVVHLRDAPDRETQRNLMSAHKRWVVDETPGARQLFFGAKGYFGWEDFLDVINPLQHIPIVAQIYRAVTGDQINGAAELIGSLPLGPLGIIGTMGAVADLAVKDTSGKDIGENLEAMVFGGGDKKGTQGTPGDTGNMAEATPVHPSLDQQTASAEAGDGGLDAEREAHDQRKA
jgi:hypothetical protein